MVFLYLVQHGEAKSEEEDPLRGLTEKGFVDASLVARHVAAIPIKPARIWHSGKRRAAQTAEIFSRALDPPGGVAEAEGLSPLDDPLIWYERLSKAEEDTMVVGHLPHLSRLVRLLFPVGRGNGAVNFKMGGVVCLKRDVSGPWCIEWMLVPEIIR